MFNWQQRGQYKPMCHLRQLVWDLLQYFDVKNTVLYVRVLQVLQVQIRFPVDLRTIYVHEYKVEFA